jgi:hypothetical protein
LVADVDAQRKIWVDALGGEPSGQSAFAIRQVSGRLLILSTGKGSEGTKGSALDHFAFNVKDLRGTRDKLVAAGVKITEVSDMRFDALIPPGLDVHFFCRIPRSRRRSRTAPWPSSRRIPTASAPGGSACWAPRRREK